MTADDWAFLLFLGSLSLLSIFFDSAFWKRKRNAFLLLVRKTFNALMIFISIFLIVAGFEILDGRKHYESDALLEAAAMIAFGSTYLLYQIKRFYTKGGSNSLP